ncbi:hypothetical protein pb186bvf_013182 [Paramecium bursaria]
MQQFQSTFSQYHPNKREEFQVGQELTMQKRKSRTSKDLIRRITIQADGFRQNNNKTIRYPSGFNLMTKADYDNIPGDKLLPWIERDFNDQQKNFVVRILFSRNNNELVQSNIASYTQPTAIYFTDLEYGKSFIRFLRLKSQEKEENKQRFKRLFQLYQKRCVINVFQQANRKLEFASKLIQKEQQRKRDELKRCKDISNYDKNNFQKIFRHLLHVANKRQDEQKQNKIKFLLHKQHFYHSIQTAHKQFINKWLSIAQHKEKLELLRIEQEEFEMLEELKKQEQEEQERLLLEEEERRKQEENDKQLSKQLSEQQRKERDENSEKQGLQKQDLLLTNIKLILDPQIQLISPVMRLQFTKHSQHYTQLLESEGFKHIISNDKEYFDKFYILQKGDEGWELKQNFKLHQYKLQDVFTITIYEEGREYSERDHNRTAVDLFTKSNKKILTNNVTTLELKQNLEGVKRMYVGLNTSADFQQSYIIKNKCNYPMITLQVNSDIDMNLEAKILNQNIIHDPNNLAYIKLPIDIQDLCLLDIKNLYEDKLTEDWDKLRLRLFFQGLRNRGQNHANQLLSRDYITEAMEITQLYENGFNQDILLIDSRNHYDGLSNEKIDKQGQTQIRECLIQASLIGLDYWQRIAIIPKLLNFNTKIDLFAKQNQLAYKQNNQQLLVEFLKQYENLITNEESNHFQNLINKYFDNQKGNNDYFNNHINEWKPKACQVLNAISVLRDQHNYPEFLIPLLFKLFQFLNQPQQQHAYLDGVFMILIISEIDVKFPENSQKQLDRLGVSIDQLFFQHAKGVWADFFYYDAWLRVFDYYCGQLYNNQDPKKIIGSIVSGILQGVNIQNIQSKQELLQKLKIYGQLTCNLDLLIQDSHNSLLHDNFTSQGDSLMRKFIQELDPELRDLSAINHILRDQQKFDPNSNEDLGEEIIYEFEVPDEHENSIYRDTQEQFIEIQSNVSDRFVQKSKPISIQLYINQIYIHTTSYNQVQVELQYGQQVANKIFGESQLHFTFNYDGSNIIKVLIHNQVNKFEQAINIYKYRFNQVTKDCLLLKDNYETEKHYQLSSFEFSIKVIDNINSAPLTQILDDHIRQTIGSNNKYFGFTSPQEWKKTNQMNYSQFKQLVWKYFQCDASRFNLQELFTYLRNGDGVYLIDFIAQYINVIKYFTLYVCFSNNQDIVSYMQISETQYTLYSFKKIRMLMRQPYLVMLNLLRWLFLMSLIPQEINLTQSFNKYLLENFKNLNSYDILLFDAEYKVPLQDILDQRTFEQVRQLNTQQYKLKLKAETFGQIRKLNFNLSRGFQLINQFEKLENEVSQFDVTNKILSLDCHGLINEQEFTRYLKKIWVYENYQSYSLEKPLEYYGFMRLKVGLQNKKIIVTEVAKYLLINFQGLDKQHVLYKQDVFGIKSYEEIDAVDKFWKQ